jgi:hypothetical protein
MDLKLSDVPSEALVQAKEGFKTGVRNVAARLKAAGY